MTKKNWNHLSRRGLAMLLALIMCLGMLPVSVFADENDAVTNESSSVSENAENGSVNQTEEEAEEPVQEEAEEPAQEETEEPTQEETEEPAQEENTSFLNTNTLSDRSNAPQAKLPCSHWDVLGVKSTWETVSTTPATCTSNEIEHQVCSQCGDTRDHEVLLSVLEHDWQFESCAKDLYTSLCSVGHKDLMKCSRCGKEEERVNVAGHSHDFVFTSDAVDLGGIGDYDTDLLHTVKCTKCTAVETRFHDYVNTCVKSEYCSVCGHVKVKGELAQHQADTEWTTDETNHWHKCVGDPECTRKFDEAEHTAAKAWTTDVNQHWHVCGTCGAVVGDKANHTWNDGEVTTEPTTTTEGVKTFTCTVCRATKTEGIDPEPVPETKYVCQIGETQYETIQAAVDSVEENGTATIEMIADSDKPATIPAGKEITLNLNGKTLTNKETNASSWSASTLRNYGMLTVAGEGTIRADASKGNSMVLYNYEGGTTILNGGTYINDNGDYTVWNQGTMVINNATMIKEKAGSPSILINGWRNGGSEHPNGPNCSLTINNCSIEGKVSNSIAVKNDDWGELVIKGGAFSAGICLQNANIAEIRGGEFRNPVNNAARLIYHNPFNSTYGKGELTISGGDFYSVNNETAVIQRVSQNSVEGKLEVSGGTYFKEDAVVNQYATEGRKLVPIEGQKDRWQLGKDAPGIDLDSLELKVLVQCVNEGRAHVGPTYEEDGTERQTITAAEYALIQDSVTVSEPVKNSEGQLTCTVTVEAEKYVSLFNGTVVYKHLPLNQKASVTLTCQDDTWVADGKLLFECVCMPKTEGIVELFVECEENTDHNLMWNNVNYEVFQDKSGRQLVNLTDNDEDSATQYPFVCTMTMGAPANILDRYYNGYVKYCVKNAPDSPVAHFGLHELNGEKTGTPSVTFYWNADSAKWECVNNRVVLFAHGTKQITYCWLDEDGTTALQEPVTQSACKAAPDDPAVAEKSLADGSRKVFREWTEAVDNDGNVTKTAVYDTISATSRAITVNYVDAQGNVISTATVYGTNGLSYTLTSAPAALDANGNRYVLNDTMPKAVGANESSVNVRYAIDNIGGGADGRSPDGIPDIQEAVVYYTTSNEAYGTVAGAYQTFNLGSANASGTVTLGNTASTTTLSRTYFSSWTQSGTVLSTGTDLNVEFAVTAGSTYQVIANFGRTGTGGGGGGGTGGGGTTGGGGGGTTIVDEEVPLAGDTQLNRDDHFAYVSGYADGTVRPTNNITREEVAAIFYRLLTEESRAIYDTDVNDFSDVAGDRWSNRAISTLTNAGILSGYPDGTFRPGQTITRAEFAAIAAQFDVVTEGVENPFSDTTGHWAENLISFAAGKGWVSGYTDGTFLPQKAITRAEAMTLINNVLNRRVDAEGLLAEARQWSDNPEGTWYYYEVLEATNSHDYDRRTEGELVENWTAVTNG